MPPTFRDLGVPADLAACLAERGITDPFPIQAATLADALAGRDVCGRAPTGSGKTLAFGLPLVLAAERATPRRPTALVLAPTRELAAQITAELTPLAAIRSRRVCAVYGGVGFGPQLAALRSGVDILVACPGRLADLVRRGDVRLDRVGFVVLDEADRMADMGFLPEVKRLLDTVRADRQTLLFSATLDHDVDVLVRRYQRDPARHEVAAPDAAEDRTDHLFWRVPKEQRLGATVGLVDRHVSTIVFCRTRHGVDRLVRQLEKEGVSAAGVHGDRSQAQRERALAAFSARRLQVLVATDVAARGIHVDGVACVVHYDPPADGKDYLHRSGRTGRAGAAGRVVSFVGDEHVGSVKKLQRTLGFPVGVGAPSMDGLPDAGAAPAAAVAVAAPPSRPSRPPAARPRGQRRRPRR